MCDRSLFGSALAPTLPISNGQRLSQHPLLRGGRGKGDFDQQHGGVGGLVHAAGTPVIKKITQEILSKMSVADLVSEIRRHNRLYFEKNEPEISDEDFDRLVERLKKIQPDSPVLFEIGSDIRKGVVVPKIPHR